MNDREAIEEIKNRIDLVNLVSRTVTLKKAGRHYKGLCPFHQEKTPSFIVSPEIGSFKCFGCGKGGDAFTFLMETDGFDFPEALKTLAKETGVKLPEPKRSVKDNSEILRKAMEASKLTYNYLLTEHKSGKITLDYLLSRGLTPETINEFGFGFAPNTWHFMENYLKKKGFNQKDLLETGLITKNENGKIYDRFRGRLMIPINDERGQLVGYTARITEKDQEPKYINSPESNLYHKSQVLFNLDNAKRAIKKEDRAIIVEGPFDALIPGTLGVPNIVATLGTALTKEHLKLLSRYTLNIVLCFDSDAGGSLATDRAIELASGSDLNILVAQLPQGVDPDELAVTDPAILKGLIEKASPIFDYYFNMVASGENLKTAKGKKAVKDRLLPIVAGMKDKVLRDHYQNLLEEIVESKIDLGKVQIGQKSPAYTSLSSIVGRQTKEQYLLSLLMNAEESEIPLLLPQLENVFEDADQVIYLAIVNQAKKGNIDIKALRDAMEGDVLATFERIFLTDVSEVSQDQKSFRKEWESVLRNALTGSIKLKLKRIATQLKLAEDAGDFVSMGKLQTELTETMKKLI